VSRQRPSRAWGLYPILVGCSFESETRLIPLGRMIRVGDAERDRQIIHAAAR
jgi:hypothetical protein